MREQSLRVQHPHVVAPTGWSAQDDDVLLTMDLVGGGSLDRLLGDHGPLPLAVVVPLLHQLLDALGAVHAAGLVHRDVTPANVLLEPTGTAPPVLRLADFGIASAVDGPRLTGVGLVAGTRGHVAPEARDGADPDPRQDLWAVGVLAAQLLTARRPDLDADRPPLVPGLAWSVQAWVDRLGDPDPARRPPDAAAARAALDQAVAGLVLPVADEPVEVFDHLAALPPGWGPDGPVGADERRAGQGEGDGTVPPPVDRPGAVPLPERPGALPLADRPGAPPPADRPDGPQTHVSARRRRVEETERPDASDDAGGWSSTGGAVRLVAGVALVAVGLVSLAQAARGEVPPPPPCVSRSAC